MGIPHIEDLEPEEFLSVIKRIKEMRWTEKLDGSNLILGVDAHPPYAGQRGNYIYTSRAGKGGDKFQTPFYYPRDVQNNGFRSAHAALAPLKKTIMDILDPGDEVELEILYGRTPNSVAYGDNYIVPIRMLSGRPEKLDELTKVLFGKEMPACGIHLSTKTGYELITRENHKDLWKGWNIPLVHPSFYANLPDTLPDKIEKAMKDHPRSEFKTKKAWRECMKPFMMVVKEELLTMVVRRLRPALRTVDVAPGEDFGIEGVVLLDHENNKQYKLVDKEGFTKINQFYHAVRNEIKMTSYSRLNDTNATVDYKVASIYDLLLEDFSRITGLPLDRYLQLTRKLKKRFNNIREFVDAWNVWNLLTLDEVKEIVLIKIRTAIVRNITALDRLGYNYEGFNLELDNGTVILYTDDILYQTQQMIAQMRRDLEKMHLLVAEAADREQLAKAMYGKSLDCIR